VSAADWGALVAGAALILWINWYFFFSGREGVVATVGHGGVIEVPIVVKGGYVPNVVRVPLGGRVRLVFDRQESSGCSEEVVFPSFGIRRFLPAFEKTTVELELKEPGRYDFTCGMSMLRGALVVEKAA
jgi:plastocyanin domain-containing protein